MSSPPAVLLTGATGHVGQALVPRLAATGRVIALIRAKDAAHLAERLAALRRRTGVDALEGVRGDTSEPALGLSSEDRARLLDTIDSVLHSAASVRFDQPADNIARQNVAATEAVLALAGELRARGRLRRYDHVSTAYIAGDRTGRVLEDEIDVGQGFRNTYEWSKCQAELKVKAASDAGLPVAVHRPSIVVGDSRTGETEAFNVLYWPLKLYARGWWRTFPGKPETQVDVVPVDWLADAIVGLRARPESLGRRFHLCAGDDAPTVQQVVDRLRPSLGAPPLRYVDQGKYRKWVRPVIKPLVSLTARGRAIMRGGEAYMPYFMGNPLFDTAGTRALLGEAGKPPPFLDYLERIIGFAREKDFGGR